MIPRDFFPNMPDEVFGQWLAPIAEEYGWPFSSELENTEESKWFYVLGKLPLTFWVRTEWALFHFNFKSIPWCYGARLTIASIIQRCVDGSPTLFDNVEKSEARFQSCINYIKEHKKLPGSIVAMIRDDQVDILDGNHRLSALVHLGIDPSYEIPMWIPKQKIYTNATA